MVEIEQLIEEYKDKLYRLCLYLEKNNDKAEELFQDTWLKALEKMYTYDREKPFYPWLTQVAVNLYRDKLRRFRLELKRITFDSETLLEGHSEESLSMEEAFIRKEELGRVMGSIKALNDKYKLPLLLVLGEQMSYKEAGEVLGVDEKLVKSRIYDGRQKLKKILEKEGVYD